MAARGVSAHLSVIDPERDSLPSIFKLQGMPGGVFVK